MRVTTLAAVAALASVAILGSSTAASAAPAPIDPPPTVGTMIVGAVSAPLAAANIVCPAPWNQGGFGLEDLYTACVTAPVTSR